MANEAVGISRMLDPDGRLIQLPKKKPQRAAVLAYLAGKFQTGRDYREREVNALLDEWHLFSDCFLLRRELIEAGFLCRLRDGSRYWRPEKAESADECGESAPHPCKAPEDLV